MNDYRRSNAFQLTRSLLASVYAATPCPAADPAGELRHPVRELRRAALTAVARLSDAAIEPDPQERQAGLGSAREALREVALYLNVCHLQGKLPTATTTALLARQAEAAAELARTLAAARSLAS